ncbi:MAG: outer membrane protein assembly factor BamB family protein [Pirellulaceae bacterium]
MIRRLFALLLLLVVWTVLAPVGAEPSEAGLITSQSAQRYGLDRAWFTQLNGSPAPGLAGNLQLHVSTDRSQTVFLITDQHARTYSISDRHLDTFGQPLGVEGAQKAASEKMRLLRLEGVEATVQQNVIPDITLYATTTGGVIHAIDAETGTIRWTTPVGQSDYPTTAATVNDQWVAVINGQHLYLLRAGDGSIVEQRRLIGGVPAAGPAIAGNSVCVAMLNGSLYSYTFGPTDTKTAEVYYAPGIVQFKPTAIGNRVLWPTNKGVITAIEIGRAGVTYRLLLEDAVAGPLVYSPPSQLLVVTDRGYLYSFDVKTGGVKWRFSTGDRTAEPASVVGTTVYLMSREAGMHAVSTETGEDLWWAPSARRFIAATKEKVYASTHTGTLLVLDIRSGAVISEIPIDPTNRVFVNNQTDRIYVGTSTGLVQCLHELDAYWPTIHVTGGELAAADAAEAEGEVPAEVPAEAAGQPTDPFAPQPTDPEASPRDEPAGEAPRNPFADEAASGELDAGPVDEGGMENAEEEEKESDAPFEN